MSPFYEAFGRDWAGSRRDSSRCFAHLFEQPDSGAPSWFPQVKQLVPAGRALETAVPAVSPAGTVLFTCGIHASPCGIQHLWPSPCGIHCFGARENTFEKSGQLFCSFSVSPFYEAFGRDWAGSRRDSLDSSPAGTAAQPSNSLPKSRQCGLLCEGGSHISCH